MIALEQCLINKLISKNSWFNYNIRIKSSSLYLPIGLSRYCRLEKPAARTQLEIQNVHLSTSQSVVLMEKPMGTTVYSMKPKGKMILCVFVSGSIIVIERG